MKSRGIGLIALIVISMLMLNMFIPVSAAGSSLTMAKTVYNVGESPKVHYTGTSLKDWIGIYKRGQTPSSSCNSIVWECTSETGQPDGTMDFKKAFGDTVGGGGDKLATLEAGEYEMILMENYGYTVLARVPFTIKATGGTINMSKTVYAVGERPVVTYAGTSLKDWIGIFKRGQVPSSSCNSLVWEYTDFEKSHVNSTVDFTTANGGDATKLAAGDYDMILCENDDYKELTRIPFTVKEKADQDKLLAPKSVQYTSANKGKGYADGSVVITPPDNATGITAYWLYWGNDSGILKGYTPMIAPSSGTFQIQSGNFIPAGATKLYAYSVSGDALSDTAASVSLPSGSDLSSETPLYSFEVISDTHITSDAAHIHAKHLDMAYKDIKANDPDSIGIFTVGDLTDSGASAEFDIFKTIVDANKQNLPNLYFAIGNHDLRSDWNTEVSLFNTNTGSSVPYYSKDINNSRFIFLGSQEKDNQTNYHAFLHDDQLNWLKDQLETASKGAKPIFVFLHQPLINTVAGSINGQGWNGVEQDAELRAILDKYPQVVMFTGHTHWELDSNQNMYDGDGTGASFFNDASVGYLWTDADSGKVGSQGLYVEVYSDKILVRGRDFVNGKWVSNAQFMSDIKKNIISLTNAIPTDKDGLIAQKDKVEKLLADIKAMPQASQTAVADTVNKLDGLATQIKGLQTQVNEVSDLISKLPKPENVKLADASKIEAAKSAYDNLTSEQKKLLESQSVTLTAAVKALSSLGNGQGTNNSQPQSNPDKNTNNSRTGDSLLAYLMVLAVLSSVFGCVILKSHKKNFNKNKTLQI